MFIKDKMCFRVNTDDKQKGSTKQNKKLGQSNDLAVPSVNIIVCDGKCHRHLRGDRNSHRQITLQHISINKRSITRQEIDKDVEEFSMPPTKSI